MKKIFVFLAPIIILAIIYDCSKDHSAPTFSEYKELAEPTDVVATYDKNNDAINVSWTMEDTDGVANYLVAWSDSNVFDDGKPGDQYVRQVGDTELKKEITLDATDVLKEMDLTYAKEDSFIVHFTVSALYTVKDPEDTLTYKYFEFIGPRAVVDRTGAYADSALILRK